MALLFKAAEPFAKFVGGNHLEHLILWNYFEVGPYFYLAIFTGLYGIIPNPKMAFTFPIPCILAVIFPILIKYFPHVKEKVAS